MCLRTGTRVGRGKGSRDASITCDASNMCVLACLNVYLAVVVNVLGAGFKSSVLAYFGCLCHDFARVDACFWGAQWLLTWLQQPGLCTAQYIGHLGCPAQSTFVPGDHDYQDSALLLGIGACSACTSLRHADTYTEFALHPQVLGPTPFCFAILNSLYCR